MRWIPETDVKSVVERSNSCSLYGSAMHTLSHGALHTGFERRNTNWPVLLAHSGEHSVGTHSQTLQHKKTPQIAASKC